MTALVLGPLLRHVSETSATVWVETSEACEVSVLGRIVPTFALHGHHFALVDVDGLEPGSVTPYEVGLDGRKAWPEPGSEFPASVIRTLSPERPVSVSFGSCRIAPAAQETHGIDALSAFAHALKDGAEPPTVLLMIGDQVYADGTGERMQAFIKGRRDITAEPFEEIADFEEYTELYRLAWMTDPAVRWLLSTVPTFSIFDDHDVRDDWNTSFAWREWIWTQPWWRRRIVGGLGSYWVYQHLGNLSPQERSTDALYAAVLAAKDGGQVLDEFAERADKEPSTARWSFTLDLGKTRVVVVDSRASRLLTADRRAMLDDAEQEWFDSQLTGGLDHLLIASSLPYLLPPAIHHAEAWNERIAARRQNGFGEKLRRFADLEHWAAFDSSFRRVAEAVTEVAEGKRGDAPACIAFLSGDIHYSYLARVKGLPITQIVCSPFRNPLNGVFKWANRLACVPGMSGPARLVAMTARAPKPPLKWSISDGPWFDNAIATVATHDRAAKVLWRTPSSPTALRPLHELDL
ncbi:alkaline phosphatase D family protein [Actinocorallia longicatena]|uniref:Alkaline phosphatase D family protein n=1 Tax=Actinocorallia longicatena TaxID=111803 RepID=A0ABP6QK01_9ACTN